MAFDQYGQPDSESYQQPQVTQQQMMQQASMVQPQVQSSPQGQPGQGGNFSGQLNDMLAPYQSLAKQVYNPYATMSQNSWLVRNHPQAAGMLDNAFLTMGMTPEAQGPEGVGGGISRAMQGLMGGQQFRRQQVLQSAMLPYEMAGRQLQMQDVASQINERNAMIPYRMAQEDYMMKRGNAYEARADEQARHNMRMEDEAANTAKTESALEDRYAKRVSGITDLSQADPQQLESYMGAIGKFRALKQPSGLGSYEEQIENMRRHPGNAPEDMAIRQEGEQRWKDHLDVIGLAAGSRLRGEEPTQTTKSFTDSQQKIYEGMLPKAKPQGDWEVTKDNPYAMYHSIPGMENTLGYAAVQKQEQAAYADYKKKQEASNPQLGTLWGAYMQTPGGKIARQNGVPFTTFAQNPQQYAPPSNLSKDPVSGATLKNGAPVKPAAQGTRPGGW
jgi:hypothetical protein